ncbi:B-cell lymphoma 3-encoded protein [Penicillium odoratum]|uniref:B-cell lymphoma 3-encoded protein n=1 Tax=Penicillium odoratum TaxID=1167516 RepID=UPI0025494B16|nr:B-cell lymphoma 3-encoded protein [Penicillium odoratum]KAJ5761262.1 B-cell lymphoma 3-encoded protein [Penicillium odoratum]
MECSQLCKCQCYVRTASRTPRWLRETLGELFYGYSGTPVLGKRPCNYSQCKKTESSSCHFTYFFPHWALSRALHVSSKWKNISGTGISWTIRMPRVISPDANIWNILLQGTIPQLQDWMARGLGSIYDVSPRGQSLALHCIQRENFDMVRFLQIQGADLTWKNEDGRRKILWPNEPGANVRDTILNDVMKEGEDLLGFNPLHRAVQGMSGQDLEEVVEDHWKDVNSQDNLENTPLWWAALMDNREAVGLLLKWGADTGLNCSSGEIALHAAALKGNVEIARHLLDAGSNVHATKTDGVTPLQLAALGPSAEMVRLLVAYGAVVDSTGTHGAAGVTPLHRAASMGYPATVQALIDAGADMELPWPGGSSSIGLAATDNNLAAFSVLRDAGARLDFVSDNGATLLHVAALRSNSAMMRLISQSGPDKVHVDISTPDNFGNTPLNCFLRLRERKMLDEKESHEEITSFYDMMVAFGKGQNEELAKIEKALSNGMVDLGLATQGLREVEYGNDFNERGSEDDIDKFIDAEESIYERI